MSDAEQGRERRPRTTVGRFLAQQVGRLLAQLRAQAGGLGRLELAAIVLLLASGLPLFPLFLMAAVGGIVLLWGSPRWTLADKLLGTLVSGGMQVVLFADTFLGWAVLLIGLGLTAAWLGRRARTRPARPVRPGYNAVAVPAGIAVGLAILLGTVGYFGVGFGLATSCTDRFEAGHRCDSLYHWLDAGAIGQIAIAVTAAAVIIVAQETQVPQGRLRPISLALIPLPLIWIVITSIGGGQSFA